jgi:membrane-associated phospholipid phosphatase
MWFALAVGSRRKPFVGWLQAERKLAGIGSYREQFLGSTMLFSHRSVACAGFAAILVLGTAHAEGLPFDHKLNFDNSGIWKRTTQLAVVNSVVFGSAALALWEGGDTRLGRTAWQSIDSIVLGAVSSETLKRVIQRPRPAQDSDPDEVRKGNGHYSFPSGEVTAVTAAITPFVLEYAEKNPFVYGLYALPAYDAVARLKSNAHWQSDVLAGFALGSLTGYYAHHLESPFMLSVMPHAVSVGLRTKF